MSRSRRLRWLHLWQLHRWRVPPSTYTSWPTRWANINIGIPHFHAPFFIFSGTGLNPPNPHWQSWAGGFELMSDLQATVIETKNGFHVDGYEKISYDFTFLDGVFNPENRQLAACYERWGRVLAVTDLNVYNIYGDQIEKYFEHHNIALKVHKTKIGEKAKTIPTFLSIVDSMTEFGIIRKVRAPFMYPPSVFKWLLLLIRSRSRFWWWAEASSRMLQGKSPPLLRIMLTRSPVTSLTGFSPAQSSRWHCPRM